MERTDRLSGRDFRPLLLCLLLLLLPSCLATYTDFPAGALQARSEPRKSETFFYRVIPFNRADLAPPILPSYFYFLEHDQADRYVIQGIRENPVFAEVAERVAPPLKGRFCLVRLSVKPESASWPAIVQRDSYTVLLTYLWPAYSGDGGYQVAYSLYVDQELREVYRYNITVKAAQWIGLLPLVWINALTYDAEEAFKATAIEFFRDAEKDGHLS